MSIKDFVAGKTVSDILDTPYTELKKMTDSELRATVGRLVSAGNKRLRRYESKRGELPRAGSEGTYDERKFSVAGKDRAQLMEEYKRAKTFMRAQISSLRGEKAVKRESQKVLKDNFGINVSDEEYDIYWKAYDRLKELHPEIDERNYKYVILSTMDKMIEQRKGKQYKSYKTFARAIEKKIDKIYEENQEVINADGTSGFFEV